MPVDTEIVRDPIPTPSLVISPDARASLQIQLVNEIVITGIDEEQYDLSLNFLVLRPEYYRAPKVITRTR